MNRLTILAVFATVMACQTRPSAATEVCGDALGPGAATCTMAAYPLRSYDVYVPQGDGPFPVIFAVHGGGGNRVGAIRGTCPDGKESNPRCLHNQALTRGYVVVSADGTSAKLRKKTRSWNGGGGSGTWRCTGGRACETQVDELAYFNALLADLGKRVKLDRTRLYVTGLSNGGTMSHRLACQLDGVRAVFAIGGTMQWTTGEVCKPKAPVAVVHAHGTEDECWPYKTGPTQCPIGQKDKIMKGVDETMSEWATILGCSGQPTSAALPDRDAADGTKTTRSAWPGCTADLQLLRIEGGGHTWPNGYQYLPKAFVGRTTRDWGNEVILDWFDAH